MAASARYFDLVREMKNAYNHRLRLVESVKERGIKPTARLFATSRSVSGGGAISSTAPPVCKSTAALRIASR
jgi:hypothetical protein